MAKKALKIKVIFYKSEGGLNNNPQFPLRGWLYGKGQSLKGISPKDYEEVADLATAVKEIVKATGASTLYFTEAAESEAVMTFSF